MVVPFTTVSAFSGSEVHITKDGLTSISGAKVMQLAGGTLFMRLYWGDAYVRFTIKTNSKTKILRATNEETTMAEVSEGDLLDVTGELESGGNSLIVVASTIRNSSVDKKQATFSGKVSGVDLASRSFTLVTKTDTITVQTGTTTQFLKGTRTLDLEHVSVGDTVLKTSGDYNLTSKLLSAQLVTTYVDLNNYKPRNFDGVLAEVSGTSLPTSVRVTVGNIKYTVNIKETTSLLSKTRSTVVLSRFVVGDKLRLYGAIREVDDPIIDAEIVRNMSL